jgi:hypothetical protein
MYKLHPSPKGPKGRGWSRVAGLGDGLFTCNVAKKT